MCAWWRRWAIEAGLPPDVCDRGEICLNEAADNIIQHGVLGDERAAIEIAFDRSPDAVQITIIDSGVPFSPLDEQIPERRSSPGTARVGGFGIPLMRHFANEISYRREGRQNVLALIFRP
jgi:serine/threonine-protein kinase RsbW